MPFIEVTDTGPDRRIREIATKTMTDGLCAAFAIKPEIVTCYYISAHDYSYGHAGKHGKSADSFRIIYSCKLPLQVQHFYIFSPRCSDGFYNVLSDEDGWWIRTTFIRFIASKVHLLDNFTYNHSVPTRTRTCHAQQNSFCCCHPPYYKRTHVFAHD